MIIRIERDGPVASTQLIYSDGPCRVPCFTLPHLRALYEAHHTLNQGHATARFQVLHSDSVEFSLGGDLRAFIHMVRDRNKAGLTAYAYACMKLLLASQSSDRLHVAAVRGKAYGGGWECVLAHDYIIATEDATFCFPELTFGAFPGMGGLSLLTRRVGRRVAVEMCTCGGVYSAAALHELGLVDLVVGEDELGVAVSELQHMPRNKYHTLMSMKHVDPIPERELSLILQRWVNAMLELTVADLDIVQRIASIQERKYVAKG